jgi:hypothetical protein
MLLPGGQWHAEVRAAVDKGGDGVTAAQQQQWEGRLLLRVACCKCLVQQNLPVLQSVAR